MRIARQAIPYHQPCRPLHSHSRRTGHHQPPPQLVCQQRKTPKARLLPAPSRLILLGSQQQPHVPRFNPSQRRRIIQASQNHGRILCRQITLRPSRRTRTSRLPQVIRDERRETIRCRLHVVSLVWRRLSIIRQGENGYIRTLPHLRQRSAERA